MRVPIPFAVFVLCCACVACASDPAPVRPATPAPDAPQSIPTEFIVSTNEPFWQARVVGDTVRLAGVQGERRFAVEANEAVFDGRAVRGRDATGTIELRVTERLCQDSMSGAEFAYTGRLVLDGAAPVMGCGRPSADASGE